MILAALVLSSSLSRAAFWSRGADTLVQPAKLFDAGQYAQVVARLSPEEMQRLRSDDLPRAYSLLGRSLESLGHSDQALGVFQLGVKLFPNDLPLLTELGSLLHQAGLEERAQPLFEKVISIHPNNAEANLGLAEIDHSLGFLERSAEHYEKALETDGSQAEIWASYGDVLHEKRDDKTAEQAYRQSLKVSPTPQAAIGLAFALRGQGKLDAALDALPQTPQAGSLRGLWLLEAGREKDALAAVAPLLKDAPDDPLLRYIRARVRLKEDRYNDAVADLKIAARDTGRTPFVAKVASAMLKSLTQSR